MFYIYDINIDITDHTAVELFIVLNEFMVIWFKEELLITKRTQNYRRTNTKLPSFQEKTYFMKLLLMCNLCRYTI